MGRTPGSIRSSPAKNRSTSAAERGMYVSPPAFAAATALPADFGSKSAVGCEIVTVLPWPGPPYNVHGAHHAAPAQG